MDSRGNQLLHVDIQIDEQEPRRGILDLLSRLRPHWRAEDIQMKASDSKSENQQQHSYICFCVYETCIAWLVI